MNANEEKVMRAIIKASALNGHDFIDIEGMEIKGLNQHQIAGYMSDFTTKGFIYPWEGLLAWTPEGEKMFIGELVQLPQGGEWATFDPTYQFMDEGLDI